MNRYRCLTFSLLAISLLAGTMWSQSKRAGDIRISGNVAVGAALQDRVPGSSIVVALRDAATNVIVHQVAIYGPDTVAGDSGKKFRDEIKPCYKTPGGCPYAIVMKRPSKTKRRCIISVELQDALYRSTLGREGCNRILGYYTGPAQNKAAVPEQAASARPLVITVDPRHALYDLTLDIR